MKVQLHRFSFNSTNYQASVTWRNIYQPNIRSHWVYNRLSLLSGKHHRSLGHIWYLYPHCSAGVAAKIWLKSLVQNFQEALQRQHDIEEFIQSLETDMDLSSGFGRNQSTSLSHDVFICEIMPTSGMFSHHGVNTG